MDNRKAIMFNVVVIASGRSCGSLGFFDTRKAALAAAHAYNQQRRHYGTARVKKA